MVKIDAMGGGDAELTMQWNVNCTSTLSTIYAMLLLLEVVIVLAAVEPGCWTHGDQYACC